MANKTLFPVKEVAPGMFRSPTPVSSEGAKLVAADTPPPATEPTDEDKNLPPVPTGTPPEPTKPKTPQEEEWAVVIKHAEEVRQNILTKYAGKPGVNPFIWVKENIDPFIKRAKDGDRSDELKKKLFTMNSDIKPKVVVPVKEVTGQAPQNVK